MGLRRFERKFKDECRAGINRFVRAPVRRHLVERSVRHIHGPANIKCDRDEFVALSVMRNARLHVDDFIEHHLELGATQIIILDNGSTDGSLELASRYRGVTLLQCLLPFKYFKFEFRRYLFRHFADHGWALFLDIDERFCHLFPTQIDMFGFLEYLNRYNYNAVMGQMLDLFPPGPISRWPIEGKELVSQSCWYDLQCLKRTKPRTRQSRPLKGPPLFAMSGGIRATGFDMENPPSLTKYPLLLNDGTVKPSESSCHHIRGGRLADSTCLLKHYKFHREFKVQCENIVEAKSYFKDSLEYRQYLKALDADEGLTLKTVHSQRLSHVNQLLENQFLVASEQFKGFVKEKCLSKSVA